MWVFQRGHLHFIFSGGDSMTGREICARYQIPMKILQEYERRGLCGAVRMDEYDTIFLGFPIWWYVAPSIIHTFLEQYDLKGKKIIPFATSGMSGMGKTNSELKNSCKGADLREGKRFDAGASVQELKAWAEEF
jgi:hypothetical protein